LEFCLSSADAYFIAGSQHGQQRRKGKEQEPRKDQEGYRQEGLQLGKEPFGGVPAIRQDLRRLASATGGGQRADGEKYLAMRQLGTDPQGQPEHHGSDGEKKQHNGPFGEVPLRGTSRQSKWPCFAAYHRHQRNHSERGEAHLCASREEHPAGDDPALALSFSPVPRCTLRAQSSFHRRRAGEDRSFSLNFRKGLSGREERHGAPALPGYSRSPERARQ